MAYSKVLNKTQDKDVKYLNKDFNSFKTQLREFAEVYFPNNFNDFSEGNPGMMFLEMVSYLMMMTLHQMQVQMQQQMLRQQQQQKPTPTPTQHQK